MPSDAARETLAGGQDAAALQHEIACFCILTCATDIHADACIGGNKHAIAIEADVLLDRNRIRALWKWRTGSDAHAFALADGQSRCTSGELLANQAQHRLAIADQVGMTQGVAVHGAVVEWLQRDRCNHVLHQYATVRARQGATRSVGS